MRYSVIVPLYNRPEEIQELLESLTAQTFKDFEVLVIEDGSTEDAKDIVASFAERLPVQYFWKENERQGFTRNFGFERAQGEWMVVFDSDCLIPPHYFEALEEFLSRNPGVEVFGGPDAAHPSFTPVQKAISHAMTSFLTTGAFGAGRRMWVNTSRVPSTWAFHAGHMKQQEGIALPSRERTLSFHCASWPMA